jgi:aminoglycoside phosphotransferase (APT) family kinase protein
MDGTPAPERLTVARVNVLLEPWLAARELETIEPMSGGLLNRNLHLRLRGRPGEAVLRIYDHDPAACLKEVAVLGMIGRDIPVPRVLYVDEAPPFGPPVAVLSVVEGISLATLRSFNDGDAVAEAAFDAGRMLARLAAFPGPPTPSVTVVELVERFVAQPVFGFRVANALRDRVIATARRWQPRIDDAARETSLVHGDFNARNIFAKQTEAGWRVSAILDWEFALAASPYCDIGNFLRYHRPERPRFESHFSAGLRDTGVRLPDDWLSIARIMDLPALCELLGRPALPDDATVEVIDLVEQTTQI